MSQYSTPNLTLHSAQGFAYSYRRYGKKGTVPVLFLQHFRGNLDNWDPALVDAIAEEREVILVDARGVGGSGGEVPTTVRDFALDAIEFADTLGITELDLFGFSHGGFVAQEFALIRPQLVRRLILAGTGPQGGREMHGWNEETRGHAYKDVQGADDVLYLFFTPSAQSQARGAEFVGRIYTRQDGRDVAPTLAVRDAQAAAIVEWGIRDYSKLSRLENIVQPTLVANGDDDILVPTVNSYLLAGHLPNARLLIYPDAGHGFLFQYPVEFAREVNSFLAE